MQEPKNTQEGVLSPTEATISSSHGLSRHQPTTWTESQLGTENRGTNRPKSDPGPPGNPLGRVGPLEGVTVALILPPVVPAETSSRSRDVVSGKHSTYFEEYKGTADEGKPPQTSTPWRSSRVTTSGPTSMGAPSSWDSQVGRRTSNRSVSR